MLPETQQLTPLSAKQLRSLATSPTPTSLSANSPTFIQFKALQEAVENANDSIDVACPYISRHLQGIIALASARVRIRVIVDARDQSTVSEMKNLSCHGLRIYLRVIDGLHLKQLVVDGKTAFYGSNIDPITPDAETLYLTSNDQLVNSMSSAFDRAWAFSITSNAGGC